jgi:ABC-type uncharacterized transport system permease subunit
MLTPILLAIAILGYAGGAAALLADALGQRPALRRMAMSAGGLALLAHASLLFVPQAAGPASTDFFRALSLVSWAMALVMTGTHARDRARVLLVAIWPVAALAVALDGFTADDPRGGIGDWQIRLHVVIALSAYSVLAIAALQALVVAWQEHNLRRKRLAPSLRLLPPLSAMEDLLFQFIVAGFALLTLTVLSGALFIEDWMAQHLVHKTVLTIIAWVVYGVLVYGRWRFGWRGRTAVRWTLSGMGVLLLAFFGSKFVLEILLGR